MAKLARYYQKLFASASGADELETFGSLAAGLPVTFNGATATPDLVQNAAAFLGGWFSGVIGANAPAIEDMNGLFWLAFRQLAYQFQAGVAEWNSLTTYFIGSVVSDSLGTLYSSTTDNNLNHAVSDTANWKVLTKNPLTTKGDLILSLANGVPTRQAVGADGLALVADSTQTTGVIYKVPAIFSVVSKTANYNAAANEYVKVDASGGAFGINVPDATTCKNAWVAVDRTDNTLANLVTLLPIIPGQLFDNYSSLFLNTQGEKFFLVSDGVGWRIQSHPCNTAWASYTPTTQGWGTLGTNLFEWQRQANNIKIRGRFVAGTVTASEARITFPAGLTSDTSIQTLMVCGAGTRTGAVGVPIPLVAPSVTYINFSNAAGANTTQALAGSGVIGSGETVTFTAEVPILNWIA